MIYLGEVRNGVVVLRDAPPLQDGTMVRVEAVAAPRHRPVPGSREAMQQCEARWVGESGDLDQLLADVQRTRDADLTPVNPE